MTCLSSPARWLWSQFYRILLDLTETSIGNCWGRLQLLNFPQKNPCCLLMSSLLHSCSRCPAIQWHRLAFTGRGFGRQGMLDLPPSDGPRVKTRLGFSRGTENPKPTSHADGRTGGTAILCPQLMQTPILVSTAFSGVPCVTCQSLLRGGRGLSCS